MGYPPDVLEVRERESPFPEPQIESLPSGAPPVWCLLVGVVSVAVILICAAIWVVAG